MADLRVFQENLVDRFNNENSICASCDMSRQNRIKSKKKNNKNGK